ncbi:MAG: PfkB family carbohydrate kinase, partial [Bradyrhizobium sp.]
MAEIPSTGIVTLTINPAVDVSTSVKKMVPFTKMRCAQAQRDPGGGGINVARVLKRLGIEASAIY